MNTDTVFDVVSQKLMKPPMKGRRFVAIMKQKEVFQKYAKLRIKTTSQRTLLRRF